MFSAYLISCRDIISVMSSCGDISSLSWAFLSMITVWCIVPVSPMILVVLRTEEEQGQQIYYNSRGRWSGCTCIILVVKSLCVLRFIHLPIVNHSYFVWIHSEWYLSSCGCVGLLIEPTAQGFTFNIFYVSWTSLQDLGRFKWFLWTHLTVASLCYVIIWFTIYRPPVVQLSLFPLCLCVCVVVVEQDLKMRACAAKIKNCVLI